MAIKLMRVDDRLLHGQVLVKCAEHAGCRTICIVDDEVAENVLKKRILEMSYPVGYDCRICSVDEIKNEKKLFEDNVFIIVKSVETAYRLCKNGMFPAQLNLGNVPYRLGRRKINNALFLTEEDIAMAKELAEKVEVFYQAVPDDRKYDFSELL